MLNKQKQKELNQCHAEETQHLGAPQEILNRATLVQNDRIAQSGRSMVEMLGVLAIVGVLSVMGIAGYTTAMNSHRANETINKAMRLAMLVSSQKLVNNTASLSSDDLQSGSYTFSGPTDEETDGFKLTAINVPEAVGDRIRGMNIDTAKVVVSNGNITFTFKNDLSEISEAEKEIGNVCSSNTGCGEAGNFCAMNVQNTGTCQPLSAGTTQGKYLVASEKMNFWTAQNWCAKHSKSLINSSCLDNAVTTANNRYLNYLIEMAENIFSVKEAIAGIVMGGGCTYGVPFETWLSSGLTGYSDGTTVSTNDKSLEYGVICE